MATCKHWDGGRVSGANRLPLRLAAWLAGLLPAPARRWLYRLGLVTEVLRGVLTQSAPSGLTQVSVAAGPLRGATFLLDLRTEKDLWLGNYEPELMTTLSRCLAAGDVVYDVGANLGYLTVAIARLVGDRGSVHAFEPLPQNLDRLRHAVRSNHLEDQVHVVAAAVGRRPGKESFLKHESGGMGKLAYSAGRKIAYQGRIEVTVLSLDGYHYERGEPAPDWVKIDVEGGEADVLVGARRLLKEVRPGFLLEIHGPEAAEGVLGELRSAGYRAQTLTGRSVDRPAELDWKAYLLAEAGERQESRGGDG